MSTTLALPPILDKFLNPFTDWSIAQMAIAEMDMALGGRDNVRTWIDQWRQDYRALSAEIRSTKAVLRQSHTISTPAMQKLLRSQRRKARVMLALRARQKEQSRQAWAGALKLSHETSKACGAA